MEAGLYMGANCRNKTDRDDKQLHGDNKKSSQVKGGNMQQSQPTGSFPRRLTSEKIVGNPGDWNEVENKKGKNKVNPQDPQMKNNSTKVGSHNQYAALETINDEEGENKEDVRCNS